MSESNSVAAIREGQEIVKKIDALKDAIKIQKDILKGMKDELKGLEESLCETIRDAGQGKLFPAVAELEFTDKWIAKTFHELEEKHGMVRVRNLVAELAGVSGPQDAPLRVGAKMLESVRGRLAPESVEG